MPRERVGHEAEQVVEIRVRVVEVRGEIDRGRRPAAGRHHVPANDALENRGVAHHPAVRLDPEARKCGMATREARVEQRVGVVRRSELRIGGERRTLRARSRRHDCAFAKREYQRARCGANAC